MSKTTPRIETSRNRAGGHALRLQAGAAPGRAADQLAWLGLFLGALTILLVASWLSPDPRGFGTHTQLGLPACAFRALTTLPCPACGLTTGFAHMVRGDVLAALHANALSVPLCTLVGLALPLSVWASVRALPLPVVARQVRLAQWLLGLAVVGLAHWLGRIAALTVG